MGKNISSLYRFPFVYSKRPNIGPADYWSLTLGAIIKQRARFDFNGGNIAANTCTTEHLSTYVHER